MIRVQNVGEVIVLDRATWEAQGGSADAAFVFLVLASNVGPFLIEVYSRERVDEILSDLAPQSVEWCLNGAAEPRPIVH